MYADRNRGRTFNPGSLAIAGGVNAVLVAALLHAGGITSIAPPLPPLTTYAVPPEPLPRPEPLPPEQRTAAQPRPAPQPRPDVSETVVPQAADEGFVVAPAEPTPFVGGAPGGTGTGEGPVAVNPPRPATPVIVAPGIDPRYADRLQPTYPPGERRAGTEGRVVVRVLVGVDGRVVRLERIAAASDAFWRATEDQALRRWRFTPGTRDGVPVEAWRVMTLTFRLED